MILYHVTPTKNVKLILETGLIPKIGKRSTIVGEIKKQVFLFPSINETHNALMNWMGDVFDNYEELSILKVNIRNSNKIIKISEWEYVSYDNISPCCITIEKTNI